MLNRQLALALIVFCLTSLAAWGCSDSPPAQIVVLLDTDYAVPSEVDRIRARVSRGGTGEAPWTRMFELDPRNGGSADSITLPASFGVIPGDTGLDAPSDIEIAALSAGSERVLVERQMQTSFIAGQNRLARLLLYQACESLSCGAGQTCGCASGDACNNPGCVDIRVEPDDLEPIDEPGSLPPNVEFPVVDPPDPPPSCTSPEQLCAGECVDVSTDPMFCGSCSNVCPSGYQCDEGVCVDPEDCRRPENMCTGFSFCNTSTGVCDRGCERNAQCTGENERCDLETHQCECLEDFDRCRFDCVDTSSDPRYCGDCTTICGSGEVCDSGSCIDPGDCRNPGVECTGFTFCDPDTGDCTFGCDEDEQCAAEEVCDVDQHECVCADGFHQCGSVCSPDDSVDSCGLSCVPCPVPENGTALCVDASCEFDCDPGYLPCGDSCCVDPCSCEANAIECGMTTLCDASIDCGTCDPEVTFCIGGTCSCMDPFEPNGLPSLASPLTCNGDCDLKDLDETVQGSLASAGDLDFFEIDLKHEDDQLIELEVSGLDSTPELFLTYICEDGSQAIDACSGTSAIILGLTYCRETGGSILRLTQSCDGSKMTRGTVIIGLGSEVNEFVGPCDLHSLSVRSVDPDN